MNRHLALFLLIVLTSTVTGQSITWEKMYSLHKKEVASSVAQTADGGYIVAGYTGSGYDTSDMWILRLNPDGDTLWTRLFDYGKVDWALSVIKGNDSSYVIAGFTSPNSINTGTTMKVLDLNNEGDTVWTFTDDITGLLANDVVQPSDGGYAILGCNYSDWPDTLVIVKLRENGQEDWRKIYHGSSYGIIYQMKPTQDTGYILTGQIYCDSINGYDNFLMKVDRYGDTVWTKIFGSAYLDIAYAVEEDDEGNYLVVTAEDYGMNTILYIVSHDGNIIGTKTFGLGTGSYLYSFSKTYDGGYVASGVAGTEFTDHGLLIMKFNAHSDSLWTRIFQKDQYAWSDDIHQTVDGGYIVAGTVSYDIGNSSDMWILKLDETGMVGIQSDIMPTLSGNVTISPNPFTASTVIRYSLDRPSFVRMIIYDSAGRQVDEPVCSFQAAGIHWLQWDAGGIHTGLYYCFIMVNGRNIPTKMMIIR
jgi:hypothetical protein